MHVWVNGNILASRISKGLQGEISATQIVVHMRKAFKFCRSGKRIRAQLTSKSAGVGVLGMGWDRVGNGRGAGEEMFCFLGIMTITVESGLF